jgi:2'-5' RNA ligase
VGSAPAAARVRAFLALEIPPEIRAGIRELIRRLEPRVRGVRWVRAEGIHVTLRFLGPSSPAALAAVEERVRPAARACPRGEARVGGLGLFPERGAPRVLWLAVALPEPVLALQRVCEEAAAAAGFEPETRPFRSHLTLGRWRGRAPRPDLADVDLGTMPIDRLVLFRSQLHPKGAIYTPLQTYPCGTNDG